MLIVDHFEVKVVISSFVAHTYLLYNNGKLLLENVQGEEVKKKKKRFYLEDARHL